MTIAAILERKGRNVISVEASATVREAVALLAENKIGALPVLDGGRVAGVMSERDVIYCLRSEGAAVLDWTVDKVMTAPVTTVEPQVSVLGALSQMTKRRFRHLPVVEGGNLVGFVSIGDLVAFRISRIEEEAEAMRSYIQGG